MADRPTPTQSRPDQHQTAQTAPPNPAKDPDGVGSSSEAAGEETKGRPTSDRHKMQNTVGEVSKRR